MVDGGVDVIIVVKETQRADLCTFSCCWLLLCAVSKMTDGRSNLMASLGGGW